MLNENKINLLYYEDLREEDEVKGTSYIIDEISKNNIKQFCIYSQDKTIKKKQHPVQDKVSRLIRRKDFPNGWFCHYTDSNESNTYYSHGQNGEIAILSIHGCPGNHKEWLRLEKGIGPNFIRWINFIVPGFDSYDERRGDYNGSAEHICQLILLLIQSIGIQQLILCGHSMGSYITYKFNLMYPKYTFGLIEMAAAPIQWYLGMKNFFASLVAQFGEQYDDIEAIDNVKYYYQKEFSVLFQFNNFQDNQIRQKMLKIFKDTRYQYKIQMEGVGNLNMVNLNEFEYFASYKLFKRSFSNKGWSQAFQTHQNLLPSLKFFCCGKHDIIIEKSLFEMTFNYFTFGEKSFQRYVKYNKKKFEQLKNSCDLLKNLSMNLQDLQQNFIFMFDKTGHTVHNKRGLELGHPLRIYVETLQLLKQCEQNGKPKL